jgi:hypothetical protein
MNIIASLKTALIALLIVPAAVVSQSAPAVDIGPYMPAAYTNNFTRSIEFLASGKADTPNGSVKAVVSGMHKPGSRVSRFDREWIGAEQTGLVMIGDDKFDSSHFYLYDPKTGHQAYMIDQDDDSFTRYEWMGIPTRLPLGEATTVGRTTGLTKDGKLTSVGLVALRATETKAGLEFCQIETAVEAESGDKRVSEECMIFDKTRRPVASRASLEIDGKKILEVSGPVRLR